MATKEREKAKARKEARATRGPMATLRHLRISARKVRLVVDTIRGEDVEKALNLLTFSPKSAARPLAKLLQSAVANAEVKGDYDLDKLYVKLATVDEGSTWRRWRPRAQGRATRIRKRTSHVNFELAQR
jgi:large subunit ribosomal protein L22